MRKEATIPIVLWICAAAWFHTMIAGGGYNLAVLHDDGNFLADMSTRIREQVRSSEQVVELDFGDSAPALLDDEQPPPPEPEQPKAPKTPDPKKKDEPKKDEPKKPDPKKKDEPKVPVAVQPTPPPPPPPKDQRIAVKQHVKPDQDDNPNAKFIADDANKVDEEKVATQTSHDEDDPNPAPGGNHAGPNDAVGNAEKTKVAESQVSPGAADRAPGEKGSSLDLEPPQRTSAKPANQAPPPSGGDGRAAGAAAKAPKVETPSENPPATTDAPTVAQGGWSFSPTRGPSTSTGAPNEDSSQGKQGRKNQAPDNDSPTKWLGLGGKPGPGQINLNLSHSSVIASVGQDQLRKERLADGARRLSQHRGSWRSSNFEKWRSAIENYVTSVKPGNQTSLNAARVPFASYLNGIHNRIHPLFADSFLDSLAGLPPTHPLNNRAMYTSVEIVLSPEGKLVKAGVTRTSGVTAFDIAALDAVDRGQSYGPAPQAILSSDGNVYLHWEFHRDEVFACSTANARPYILNLPGQAPTPEMPPKAPSSPEGQAPGGPRQGARPTPAPTF